MKIRGPFSERRLSTMLGMLAGISKKSAEKSFHIIGLFFLWIAIFLSWNTWVSPPAAISTIETPLPPTYWEFPRVHRSFRNIDIRKVSLMKKSQFEYLLKAAVPHNLKERFSKVVKASLHFAEKYQVDPFWVLSIMWTESHFRHSAASHVGAMGLMQIMPKTGKWLGEKMHRRGLSDHLMGPHPEGVKFKFGGAEQKEINVELGVFYLKELLESFSGNYRYATVAYNMGPAWVRKRLRKNLPVGVRNFYWDKVTKNHSSLIKPFVKKAKLLTVFEGPDYVHYQRKWRRLGHPSYRKWRSFKRKWSLKIAMPPYKLRFI